jgi:flagellar biosynthetic protein FliQ
MLEIYVDKQIVIVNLANLFFVLSKVALPILLTALVLGVFISVIQVVTQIQEMTLTFVPKLIVVLLVIGSLSNWLLTSITSYATSVISSISGL